jgi:hypothetical protein
MATRRPIATAPKDADGQENESIARYRSLDRVKAAGGDWDAADAGWWIFTDSDTQRRVEPTAWAAADEDDDQ